MINIKDTIKTLVSTTTSQEKPKNCAIVIDVSGSTGSNFIRNMTVLEKEMDIAREYMLNNIDNNYTLYTFDNTCNMYPLSIMKEEKFINMPNLAPGGSTYTHLPLLKINQNKDFFDVVILITDGQTSSSPGDLIEETRKFADKKIAFEVIAVSATNINMETISHNEENRIPGMDLINNVKNNIDKLTIYNQFHDENPYVGALSSKVDKKRLSFMGIPFSGLIPVFLGKIVVEIGKNKYDWGLDSSFFKQFLCEIGKLLSVLFVMFPLNVKFVNELVMDIEKTCNIDGMTGERIIKFIEYGFNCSKKNTPIIYTNLENHVKDSVVKHAEFADAISTLNKWGTTLGAAKTICMPSKGVCIINMDETLKMTKNLNSYPNSQDEFGNTYFGCDENQQAIRIGMREFCGSIGFQDARNSPAVIFYVLNQMSLLYLSGANIDSEHMVELRKLAIAQTSMENMIYKGKYSGIGFYAQWSQGKSVPMHFSNPSLHSSLYTNKMINPFNLSESLWWALMMSMLGIFNEQRNCYDTALNAIDVENEKEFLLYMKQQYGNFVHGDVKFLKFEQPPTSIFTLDSFDPKEKTFVLKPHNGCSTNTHYSEEEIKSYVSKNGCVWCRYVPTQNDFIQVDLTQSAKSLVQNTISTVSPLVVNMNKKRSVPNFPSLDTNAAIGTPVDTTNTNGGSRSFLSVLSGSGTQQQNINKKILINLIGITGSGKTTVATKIQNLMIAKGAKCLIVSSDKWSRIGNFGASQGEAIANEINLLKNDSCNFKVIIVDMCNENGPSDKLYGIDFSDYEIYNYYPNLDLSKYDDYECWCFHNVLSRPAFDADSSFFLSPVSAGIETCIKVHNTKTGKLRQFLKLAPPRLFYEKLSMWKVLSIINDGFTRYSQHLTSRSLDNEVQTLVNDALK